MNVMQISQLTYSYDQGRTRVLDAVSFAFESGQVYGIMGKSGVGKTTLLSVIAGLNTYEAGEIHYQGRDLKTIDREQYRSRDIGIIFQNYNLVYHLTAQENVELAMDVSQLAFRDKQQQARNLLAKVGLSDDQVNRRVLSLSGGEQQRVAIARALSYDPILIVADEPTGNLDGETEAQILDLLWKLAHEDHKCVIVVTHSERVAKVCDTVYRLAGSG